MIFKGTLFNINYVLRSQVAMETYFRGMNKFLSGPLNEINGNGINYDFSIALILPFLALEGIIIN